MGPILGPIDRVLGCVGYLGGLALLMVEAFGSAFRPRSKPKLGRALMRRLDELFRVGFPLVGLLHVGFGSFLSMQAFYGATFTSANGAVVGLGLLRNVAPMLTGFCLAAVLSVRITGELGGGVHPGLDDDPASVPDRDVTLGRRVDPRPAPDVSRLVLVRLLSSMIAGPILVLWGAAVGTMIGALVSRAMLGVPMPLYFGMIREMIRMPDALGVVVKGIVYGGLAALIACYEALRVRPIPRPGSHPAPPALRSMLLSALMVLSFNFAWFNLVYLSGNPFGPGISAELGG
jgi:phospholipid/cholesterol/gamma-HCH transport system permease protein